MTDARNWVHDWLSKWIQCFFRWSLFSSFFVVLNFHVILVINRMLSWMSFWSRMLLANAAAWEMLLAGTCMILSTFVGYWRFLGLSVWDLGRSWIPVGHEYPYCFLLYLVKKPILAWPLGGTRILSVIPDSFCGYVLSFTDCRFWFLLSFLMLLLPEFVI